MKRQSWFVLIAVLFLCAAYSSAQCGMYTYHNVLFDENGVAIGHNVTQGTNCPSDSVYSDVTVTLPSGANSWASNNGSTFAEAVAGRSSLLETGSGFLSGDNEGRYSCTQDIYRNFQDPLPVPTSVEFGPVADVPKGGTVTVQVKLVPDNSTDTVTLTLSTAANTTGEARFDNDSATLTIHQSGPITIKGITNSSKRNNINLIAKVTGTTRGSAKFSVGQFPSQVKIVSNDKQTYTGGPITSCDGERTDPKAFGYRRCIEYQIVDGTPAHADFPLLTSVHEDVTIVSHSPNLNLNVSSGDNPTNANGIFLDELRLVAPDSPGPQQGQFAHVKQVFTISFASETITLRVNCLDYEFDDVTITDITGTPLACN